MLSRRAGRCLRPGRAIEHLGDAPGLTGTAAIVLAGAVASWRAAVAILQVDAWLHAGG